MALIEDIKPNPNKDPIRHVRKQMQQLHEATNIPHLAEASVKKVQSFDIIRPGRMRGAQIKPVRFETRSVLNKQPVREVPSRSKARSRSQPIKRQQTKRSSLRRSLDFMQYPVIAAVAIGAAYSATIGQGAIGLLAVIAILFKMPSKYIFGAALVMLICIPLFQVIDQTGVSQNTAIYAYELLVLGTLLAIIELWRSDHKKPSKLKSFQKRLRRV